MSQRLLAKAAVGLATALLMFGTAQARGGPGTPLGSANNHKTVAPIGFSAVVYDFDVTGIESNDLWGSPINEVFDLDVGANSWVTGIGWDVALYAYSPSWLSDIGVDLTDSAELDGIGLIPAVNDPFPGGGSYASGGIVDLIGLGLDFHVGADGILHMQFYEGYEDFPNAPDGIWESGKLQIQVSAIPEPSTYALMLLGLAGVAAVARRRRG